MGQTSNLKSLSDGELLSRLSDLVRSSRRVEADLVAHIGEVDARKLYARDAASSMFVWCTEVLGLSEPEAYLRIAVARASRRHPVLLDMLRDGRLHLSGIALLARHLTPENRHRILNRAVGLPHRQLKELAAELEPRPDAVAMIRKLPASGVRTRPANGSALRTYGVESLEANPSAEEAEPACGLLPVDSGAAPVADLRAGGPVGMPASRATVEPLAPSRHKVQFTASDELWDKLERLQALMRTTVPDGDLATVIDLAVTEKLERLEARRFAKTKAPRKTLAEADTAPSSRHVPAPVRRAVYERDGGRCTYENDRGRRCKARDRLELHHHGTPFARGGEHSVENVRLMCRTHNNLLAEREFGEQKMAQARQRRPSAARVHEPTMVYGVGGARAGSASPP